MGPLKLPGPDGIPAVFFQKCWGFIKRDFIKAALSVLNSGRVLREANRTFISLIPKGENPEVVQDYRLISLCNVFMRVITKCIANRLAKAIPAINRHKRGKYGRFALKADMSKTYDRVRWTFPEKVMIKFAFPESLIQLIMSCVTTVSYEDTGNSAQHLKVILDAYCKASGQQINDAKSGILFSLSTRLNQARMCLRVFNIRHNKGIGTYLGIPTEFQGSKRDLFMTLTDRVMKRVSSWNGIFLSPAGRLTLISSVLSNLSNYSLSVFKIPVSVTSKINSLLSHFWWAGCKSGKNTHWCSRNFLSLPKSSSGLGMHNIECLNQALLAKKAWRIVSGQDSIFCKVFRAKLFGRQGMCAGLTYINSKSILNVWNSCWVNGETPEPSADALLPENADLKNLTVNDLRRADGSWDERRIRSLIHKDVVDHVLAIPVCVSQVHDCIYWKNTRDGVYSVKSGYGIAFNRFMTRHGSLKDKKRIGKLGILFCKRNLWKLPGPETWKVFLLRLLTDSLPMGYGFARRNIPVDPTCKLCAVSEVIMETRAHLFQDCSIVQRIWACLDLGIRINCDPSMDVGEWVINWLIYLRKTEGAESKIIKFLGTLWSLWIVRNRAVFHGDRFHPQMFYGIWRSTVDTTLRAMDVGDRGSVENKSLERIIDPQDVQEIRDGRPFYVIGGAASCNSVKVMVDAGCKSIRNAAFGWVVYAHDGAVLFSRSVRINAESACKPKL
ncbi:uncharacterized protein LOC141617885 [Silene latifolia]|uniref:uncharacterized protein LOC141617885 n=1 Tax=Silene latifolia TaxID=37657 RepID=UPI003D773409